MQFFSSVKKKKKKGLYLSLFNLTFPRCCRGTAVLRLLLMSYLRNNKTLTQQQCTLGAHEYPEETASSSLVSRGCSVLEEGEVEFWLHSGVSTGLTGSLAQLTPHQELQETHQLQKHSSTDRPRASTSSWRVMRRRTSNLGMYLPKKEAINKKNKGKGSNNACDTNIMDWIHVRKSTRLAGQRSGLRLPRCLYVGKQSEGALRIWKATWQEKTLLKVSLLSHSCCKMEGVMTVHTSRVNAGAGIVSVAAEAALEDCRPPSVHIWSHTQSPTRVHKVSQPALEPKLPTPWWPPG